MWARRPSPLRGAHPRGQPRGGPSSTFPRPDSKAACPSSPTERWPRQGSPGHRCTESQMACREQHERGGRVATDAVGARKGGQVRGPRPEAPGVRDQPEGTQTGTGGARRAGRWLLGEPQSPCPPRPAGQSPTCGRGPRGWGPGDVAFPLPDGGQAGGAEAPAGLPGGPHRPPINQEAPEPAASLSPLSSPEIALCSLLPFNGLSP